MIDTLRRVWAFASLGFAVAALGCGADGPALVPVTGTVSCDGQPVLEGEVIFVATAPGAAPRAGPIKDGEFELKAVAGLNRVEVRATRPVPGKKNPMGTVYEQYVSPQFNEKTGLTAEVTPGKENRFEFTVQSVGARPANLPPRKGPPGTAK